MGLSDHVMNNRTICPGLRALENQKYANKDCGISTIVDNKVSFAFLVSRLGEG